MTGTEWHLVTTADERSWKFDQPMVFLGEWCRRYQRRDVWLDMDAIVAEPYGRGQAARDRDYALARIIEEELSLALVEELNRFHGAGHSPHFWRILLGHWLRRYVDVVFNRYHTLKQCLAHHEIRGTSALVSDAYHLATVTSLAFILACDDDVWDNVLCSRVLAHITGGSIPIEPVLVDDGPGFRFTAASANGPAPHRFRNRALGRIDALTNFLVRDTDAFIINSYLPRVAEAKVQLRLGQVPKLWRTPQIDLPGVPDRGLRHELAERVSHRSPAGLRRCINELVFEALPVCYLEGLDSLHTQTEGLPWPKRPRFVFTSNNCDTDECFKYWAATKAENDVPYYTGQHGNNYGTHRYMNPSVEESTADKFLTWGWTDRLRQHRPAFVFTTAGRKPPAYDRYGGLLLVEVCLSHRISLWDAYADFGVYFEDQQEFVRRLAPECRDMLTVRLLSARHALPWAEQRRWADFDPTLRIDSGKVPIRQTVSRSRLVVYSYDSTGILEAFAQNIPTLAFWQNGFDHLRESAKPWYQLLVDAGIVHLTAESAACKVNAVWEDVPGWWNSQEVQTARKRFCERYAVSSARPDLDFTRLVTEPDPMSRTNDGRLP